MMHGNYQGFSGCCKGGRNKIGEGHTVLGRQELAANRNSIIQQGWLVAESSGEKKYKTRSKLFP